MLAKPLKIAGGVRVTKTIVGRHPETDTEEPTGETTSTKRRQGIYQAAGRHATSSRLIQPRKQRYVEADLVTSGGRQYRNARHGERMSIPSGSQRSWHGRREATK